MHIYQAATRKTAIYPGASVHDRAFSPEVCVPPLTYVVLGLVNEAGEVAGKLKKVLRGDRSIEDARDDIIDELGDVLWYLTRCCDELGVDLAEVAEENLNKLESRAERGVLKGDGDDR